MRRRRHAKSDSENDHDHVQECRHASSPLSLSRRVMKALLGKKKIDMETSKQARRAGRQPRPAGVCYIVRVRISLF
jgi:hypothetical protein